MPRLFIAIDPSEEIRDQLSRQCTGIEAARWVRREQLHLTLRFLGDLPQSALEDIKSALACVAFAPLTLALCGVGIFPPGKPRYAKVLWAGIEPAQLLRELKARIDEALLAAGAPPDEERTFSPHLTLARFKQPPDRDLNFWLQNNHALTSPSWQAREYTLYASELAPRGATHTAIASFAAS
jgi:2'-5' RNA ligase